MADFFDKVKRDMDKYIAKLGVKTGEFAGSAKTWIEVYTLNKQRDEILKSIGAAAYKMYKKGYFNQDRINEYCKQVEELDREIKEAEHGTRDNHVKSKKHYRKDFSKRASKRHNHKNKDTEEVKDYKDDKPD